jgi:hypothetical protein
MNIEIRENNIGIVVRGDFSSLKPTPKWLLTKGLLTQVEFIDQGEDSVITPNEIKFEIGSINFVCDPTRIQMVTTDISLSGKLLRMASDIVTLAGDVELRSVGINAGVLFTFTNLEDTLKFGYHFGMLDNLKPFMKDPRLRSVVFEDNIKANAETPKVTIKLASLETITVELPQKDGKVEKKDNIPLCALEINNHFAITNKEEALSVLQKAEVYHADFREFYKKKFREI